MAVNPWDLHHMLRFLLIGLVVTVLAGFALAVWAWTPDLGRAALEARYLDPAATLAPLLGTPVHRRIDGAAGAPTVVMLHGFGASLLSWADWADALAASHRVIRLDLPGAGLSPPDSTGDYSDARAIALVLALMDEAGVDQADLIGHSMGGRIAWRLAAAHPERVRRLVLIAPDGFASPGFDYGKPPEVPATLALMRWFLPRSAIRANLAVAYADPARMTEDAVTQAHDMLRAPGARAALLERMRQTILTDPRPDLTRITAPTLLIWGEADAMIPVTNARDYLAALPRAQLLALPGLGHLPQVEDPAAALPALTGFLAP
jgi:pimeloyl-ACP methyl ester carboxylesterase